MTKANMSRSEKEILGGMEAYLGYLKGKNPKAVAAVWTFASKVEAKKARREIGVTQVQFARLLRVSPKTVEAWEQGSKPPSGPATTWIRSILKKPDLAKKALMAAY